MHILTRIKTKEHGSNILKNSLIYVAMLSIAALTLGNINLIPALVGLVGYVLAYHSAYFFNDLMDYDIDKKSPLKRATKPLFNGLTKKGALTRMFLYLVTGLVISFSVNFVFGALVSVLLLLNFLHSSHKTRLKEKILCLPNLFVLECVKLSVAWFAVTSSLQDFPYFVVLSFGLFYLLAYAYYKKIENIPLSQFLKQPKSILLASVLFISYTLSIILYPYKIALLLLLVLLPFYLIFTDRYSIPALKLKVTDILHVFMIVAFFLGMVLLSTPVVAETNYYLEKTLEPLKQNITATEQNITVYLKNKIGALASIDISVYKGFLKL